MRETCRVCGEKRPADAPSDLCPSCLQKAGQVAKGSELEDVTILFGPASSSVLAAFGAEFGKIPPVLLRDADSVTEPGPVIRPSSEEIPNPAERSARLQIFGEIARGGMGAVLKGRDSDLGRDLAVKILLESHRDKPEMVRRFIEEAQIAGQLQHPGIVPVYELGAFGDRRPYFAMKLVKGHTLAEILANRKSLSEGLPRLLSIFESICQTMAYAHARGVIHRDLKPSNVMVGSFGEVQVMDWGLAKVLPRGGTVDDASAGHTKDQATVIATARSGSDLDLSQAGSVMGTPSYMAPEQARGELNEVDERADVFALGSIFCEILTGQPAFAGRNSGEILRKAARGELADAVARLEQDSLGHDPELIVLAKSCLAPERDDRPRNAGEIAERMSLYHSRVQERLRQSEIERAAEKARAEEATKRVAVERQRLRLTVALAASILGFIVLGGGGWAYVTQQRVARQAATERVVTAALDKATLLRGQAKAAPIEDLSKWTEALAAANEARSSLEAGEPSVALQSRVAELLATLENEQADASRRAAELDKDRKLFDRLDAIKFEFVDRENSETRSDMAKERPIDKANREYAMEFREFGIDVDHLAPEEAGRLLKQRANPQDFASRLDDWTLIRRIAEEDKDKATWQHLILTAQATDEDPWRNSLRALIGQADHEAARRLSVNEEELEKQPARSLYLLAQVLESTRSGDFRPYYLKDSIEILKRAWRISPNDYQICRTLAAHSENDRDRVMYSAAAVAAKPDLPDARRGLAEAFLPAKALKGFSFAYATWLSQDPPEPLIWNLPHFICKQLRGDPNFGYYFLLGPVWPCDPETILKIDLSEAIAELRSAIRLAPDSSDFQMSLAIALVMQERYHDANEVSRIVARIDPRFQQGKTLGRALCLKGQLELAIQLIQNDIERDPDNNDEYYFLGLLYHMQGKKELAFTAYREAASSSNGNFRSIALPTTDVLALLRDTGTPAEILPFFRDAVKDQPDTIELHEGLIQLYETQAMTDEADAERDVVIRILREQLRSKEEAWPLLQLGMTYLRRQQREEAITQFRRATELNPKSSGACNNIAWALATNQNSKLRDGTFAVEFATKACERSEWKDPVFLDTLAAAYAESGDFDVAIKWQTKAIELLTDEVEKEDCRTRLNLYQEKKPFHSANPLE